MNAKLVTCTRRIQFCAGHRVMGHENKCAHPHGHNYVVMLTASATLDNIGRVIDFGVLKDKLGGWINENWDHGFLVNQADEAMICALETFNTIAAQITDRQISKAPKYKRFLMPDNPTAENMAKFLLERVCPDLLEDLGVVVTHVRVWETENCYADASL